MIVTRTEAKALLNIAVDTYDSFIDMQIPLVEQSICDYCNNDFIDSIFDFFSSGNIIFTASNNSINLEGIGNKKLIANDTIRVYKSLRNNGIFTIQSVNTDSLIVNSINTIIDENENKGVYITKIDYPKPLKNIASKMLNFLIADLGEDKTPGAKSEKIDDYNITYEDNYQGFPISIMNSLNVYRSPYKIDLFNYSRSWVGPGRYVE